MKNSSTRDMILEKTDQLIYQKGFHSTAFSDIERTTGLSKGNITYHFKNKELILDKVIRKRVKKYKMMLEEFDRKSDTPKDAMYRFCDMVIGECENIEKFGCPVGSLTVEIAKDDPKLYKMTMSMFCILKKWLQKQFTKLGYDEPEAEEKSMEILAVAQGISVIAHSFRNGSFLKRQMEKLKYEIRERY